MATTFKPLWQCLEVLDQSSQLNLEPLLVVAKQKVGEVSVEDADLEQALLKRLPWLSREAVEFAKTWPCEPNDALCLAIALFASSGIDGMFALNSDMMCCIRRQVGDKTNSLRDLWEYPIEATALWRLLLDGPPNKLAAFAKSLLDHQSIKQVSPFLVDACANLVESDKTVNLPEFAWMRLSTQGTGVLKLVKLEDEKPQQDDYYLEQNGGDLWVYDAQQASNIRVARHLVYQHNNKPSKLLLYDAEPEDQGCALSVLRTSHPGVSELVWSTKTTAWNDSQDTFVAMSNLTDLFVRGMQESKNLFWPHLSLSNVLVSRDAHNQVMLLGCMEQCLENSEVEVFESRNPWVKQNKATLESAKSASQMYDVCRALWDGVMSTHNSHVQMNARILLQLQFRAWTLPIPDFVLPQRGDALDAFEQFMHDNKFYKFKPIEACTNLLTDLHEFRFQDKNPTDRPALDLVLPRNITSWQAVQAVKDALLLDVEFPFFVVHDLGKASRATIEYNVVDKASQVVEKVAFRCTFWDGIKSKFELNLDETLGPSITTQKFETKFCECCDYQVRDESNDVLDPTKTLLELGFTTQDQDVKLFVLQSTKPGSSLACKAYDMFEHIVDGYSYFSVSRQQGKQFMSLPLETQKVWPLRHHTYSKRLTAFVVASTDAVVTYLKNMIENRAEPREIDGVLRLLMSWSQKDMLSKKQHEQIVLTCRSWFDEFKPTNYLVPWEVDTTIENTFLYTPFWMGKYTFGAISPSKTRVAASCRDGIVLFDINKSPMGTPTKVAWVSLPGSLAFYS